MSSFADLLVCALRRAGRPLTAADVLDNANALAMDSAWPRRAWASVSAQQSAAMLRGLERDGRVARRGTAKEMGNDRPLWVPTEAYDVRAEVPQYSEEAPKAHKLEKLTRAQTYVVFDLMEELVQVMSRQRRDIDDLLRRQMDEFSNVMARTKRELAVHSIDGGAL